MSLPSRSLLAMTPFACLLLAASLTAGETSLATYSKSNGETYFALSLSTTSAETASGPREVLILVDTSASQNGAYRDDSLAAVETVLAGLEDADRVMLSAVDLYAVPMTTEFVAPRSEAMKAGLKKLNQRVPLGSTDMMAALTYVAKSFTAPHQGPRAALYIGDGTSAAGVLDVEELTLLTSQLVKQRVPFSSYAIGPHRDLPLLAALSNQTGGSMFIDAEQFTGQQAGLDLVRIARETVFWPTEVKLPATMAEVFPRPVPPLRSDRETILLGTLSGGGPQSIQITTAVGDRTVPLTWTVTPAASSEDNAYLAQLVESARRDQGATLPTLGMIGLQEMRRVLVGKARDLAKLGGIALSSGNAAGAKKLAERAIELDPANNEARLTREAARGIVNPKMLPEGTSAPLHLVNAQVGDGDSLLDDLEDLETEHAAFIDTVERNRQVQEEILKAEVRKALVNARDEGAVNADAVIENLKLVQSNVRRETQVNPEIRAQLNDQLEATIRDTQQRQRIYNEELTRRREQEAAAREQARIVAEIQRNQDRIKQIMARFNSLMDERRYFEAELQADEVARLDNNSPTSRAAVLTARTTGYLEQALAVREARHKRFVDTMYQVELSSIPFPDDPPIVYPDAEFWQDLTDRRKKYASVDLAEPGTAEERIFQELDEPTTLEFIETPLQDVVDFLKDYHKIEIQIDNRALDEVGLGPDVEKPVTRNLKGITLRSALRLMLRELELTYIVKDEVLLITTPDEAQNQLVTKVYPVADLVLPIQSGGGINPFMMGGGLGGAGGAFGGAGGAGGFGGGGLGGGGGFGGGFGGGGLGGGGFGGGGFNVADEPVSLGDKQSDEGPSQDDPSTKRDAFIQSVRSNRQVQAEILQTEVRQALRAARDQAASDPAAALQRLKLVQSNVRRATDVDVERRAVMNGQLADAIKQTQQRLIATEEELTRQREIIAAAREQSRIVSELQRNQARQGQIMARFRSLMDERRYVDALEQADEAARLDHDSPTSRAAVVGGLLHGNLAQALAVREARHQRLVETMQQVELSSVPFSDGTPIVYGDAEIWRDMTERRKKYATVDAFQPGTVEQRIMQALDEPTTLEFIEAPLPDVISYWKDYHRIEIQLDHRALDEVGIPSASELLVTRNLRGISLRSALRLVLRELDLTYIVKDEVLLITTPEEAGNQLINKVYPVADLVVPIQNGGGVNPFAMGAGMGAPGGAFGGPAGNLGGAAVGGGAGAFGGGLGGGMFNVADKLNARSRGFRAYAVEEGLTLGAKKTEEEPAAAPAPVVAPAAPAAAPARPADKPGEMKTIRLEIPEGTSVEQAWADHFAKHDEPAIAVRESVRQLMFEKKYDHVIAIIRASLRVGRPQPWMYEAMGLAMQAQQAPSEEIERAVMSAIDFGASASDTMFAAAYLSHIGLDERALQLFRQVAAADPSRPEPYIQALAISQRLDDLNGLKWACLGVLSRAWPNEHRDVENKAMRVAVAAMQQLRSEGKSEEADRFEKQLNRAVVRDCVVRVSWTGDADIDILVEEPSGTICSLRNPRTTSGGVILGDTASHAGGPVEGFSESYVCPEAFSGQYRMLLRRVWGMPTAGKVTIEITKNFHTTKAETRKEQIDLEEKDAVVIFDLAHGRRNEALADHQVANVLKNQAAISRAVLAQQLNSMSDSTAVQDLERARRQGQAGFNPFFGGRRGVGFRPVTTVLPEGTNMSATAVVSADRRYVRITATPLFSIIGDVSTFNYSDGSTGDDDDDDDDDDDAAPIVPPFRGGP